MAELTDLDGIGPAYAETLQEHGYESLTDIATDSGKGIEELLGNVNGDDIVEQAGGIITESEPDTETSEVGEFFSPGLTDAQERHLCTQSSKSAPRPGVETT